MTTQKLFNPRYLLISLGNPGPYTDTLHSAGHHVLRNLQQLLSAQQQPAFTRSDFFGKSCKVSSGDKYTLVQSPTLMNVSGGFVTKAWKKALAREKNPDDLHLVLVHDDMEEDLGVVKRRAWESSHRGHNGVRDSKAKLGETKVPQEKLTRISIGIGRPKGPRDDKTVVSAYVLSQMNDVHFHALETSAPGVLQCLDEWERKLESQAVSRAARAAAAGAAIPVASIPKTSPK